MRCLGLDLGTKTLGISISDVNQVIASTYKTLRFNENCYEETIIPLKEIIANENIEYIVLGLPKNMNNTFGERAKITNDYGNLLEEKLGIKVYYQDERLSSVSANKILIAGNMSRKKRKDKVDTIAANIILQTYLDRKGK